MIELILVIVVLVFFLIVIMFIVLGVFVGGGVLDILGVGWLNFVYSVGLFLILLYLVSFGWRKKKRSRNLFSSIRR